MTVRLYYNQRTNGGSVDWECWEVVNPESLGHVVYGDYYSLKKKDFILPEGFSVRVDLFGFERIVNGEGYVVDIRGDYEENPYLVDFRGHDDLRVYHLKEAV